MCRCLILGAVLAGALALAPATAVQIYLQADFNDKTIDAPIGEGGPTVGEPVTITASPSAIVVRDEPMATPCLQINDDSDCCAAGVRFEFLDGAEVTDGMLIIRTEMYIPADPSRGCSIAVREPTTAAATFLTLNFANNGWITCTDQGGFVGIVGEYESDRVFSVRIAFDMGAGVYDVAVDGEEIVSDEPHGVVGAGIGAVLFSYINDAGVTDSFFVDNLVVANGDVTGVGTMTWGAVKSLFVE